MVIDPTTPLDGVGWRQLQVTEVMTPGIDEPVDHAHNLLAHIQVELGVCGSLCLWVLIAYWLIKKKPWQQADGGSWRMVCVVMVLGFHSLLEYPLWHALFLFLFGFAFSLLPEEHVSSAFTSVGIQSAGTAFVIFTAWFYIDHTKAVSAYERFSQNRSRK
jgi:hypothetical protein